MDRATYNECLKPYITGSKPKEQRTLDFCIGAKMCSGKAANPDEAREICLSAPVKEPSSRRKKGSNIDFAAIANCATPQINGYFEAKADITAELLVALFTQCSNGSGGKISREKYIKKCFKKHSSTGNAQVGIKEAAKLRTLCIAEYKALGME